MAIVLKIHYKQPEHGNEHFHLDVDGLIRNSSLPGLDNGDHLLFFNTTDVRESNNLQFLEISQQAPHRLWVFIIALKAGTGNDELLR